MNIIIKFILLLIYSFCFNKKTKKRIEAYFISKRHYPEKPNQFDNRYRCGNCVFLKYEARILSSDPISIAMLPIMKCSLYKNSGELLNYRAIDCGKDFAEIIKDNYK